MKKITVIYASAVHAGARWNLDYQDGVQLEIFKINGRPTQSWDKETILGLYSALDQALNVTLLTEPTLTPTNILISALRILAVDIKSNDGVANAAIAEAAERLSEIYKETERLRRDCAEAYQVLGAALCGDQVAYTEQDAVRALDNLSAAMRGEPTRPHDDLLPWPKQQIPLD